MLEHYLRERLREKDILLMTHIVLGYPDFDTSMSIVESMVAAGVDLMELQIPFSEPIADGPVILHANQQALAAGAHVRRCLDFGRDAAARFSIPFLYMSYYNILYRFGVARFASEMKKNGLQGAIVPDLPPEEGADYLQTMHSQGLHPIFIFSPATPDERLAYIASCARGFVYCVARKGVTGRETEFSSQLDSYLARCRRATHLPLAVGFGVKDRHDVDFLRGKADIAVIGSQTIRLVDQAGPGAIGDFIAGLR
jgi:tryptophan synthase alpha chain